MKHIQLRDKQFTIIDLHKIEYFPTMDIQKDSKNTEICIGIACDLYTFKYHNSIMCYEDFILIKNELLGKAVAG